MTFNSAIHPGPDPLPFTSFTFQVQDDGGAAGGGSDLDPTAKTLSIFIYNGPSPPAGTDKAIATLEDQSYTFASADFGFTDPDDFFVNNFVAVKITALPTAGELTDDGIAVATGQLIPIQDIDAHKLRFAPDRDANGAPYATFTFQVQDDGSTAGGSSNLDPTPNAITLSVTPVNDPPSFAKGQDQNVRDESGPQSIAGWAALVSAGPTDESAQPLHFVIQTNTNAGLFAAGPTIDAAGKLTFTPTPNLSGTALISVVLVDEGEPPMAASIPARRKHLPSTSPSRMSGTTRRRDWMSRSTATSSRAMPWR